MYHDRNHPYSNCKWHSLQCKRAVNRLSTQWNLWKASSSGQQNNKMPKSVSALGHQLLASTDLSQILETIHGSSWLRIPETICSRIEVLTCRSGTHSRHPPTQLLIQIVVQFQGKQAYGTICSSCQTRSERENEFLEIEVNIQVLNRVSTTRRSLTYLSRITLPWKTELRRY